jgi:RHS repeat-associated protein
VVHADPEHTQQVRYYHQDHLGSSSAISDFDGGGIEENVSYPFGKLRNAYRLKGIQEFYGFTQKEKDNATGLHYFGARYYSSVNPFFLSVDYVSTFRSQGVINFPQQINPYSYGLNNPVKLIDPDGNNWLDSAVKYYDSQCTLTHKILEQAGVDAVSNGENAKGFAIAMLQGIVPKNSTEAAINLVSSFSAISKLGPTAKLAVNVVTTAAKDLNDQMLEGKTASIDMGRTLKTTIVSLSIGYIGEKMGGKLTGKSMSHSRSRYTRSAMRATYAKSDPKRSFTFWENRAKAAFDKMEFSEALHDLSTQLGDKVGGMMGDKINSKMTNEDSE